MSLAKVSSLSSNSWQITFESSPDNRLTPALLQQLAHALDDVEQQWRDGPLKEGKGGSVVLASGISKFFSNGLDYQSAIKDPNFFPGTQEVMSPCSSDINTEIFDPVILRLLTFPLITVAAISGHGSSYCTLQSGLLTYTLAFAGGFIVALACDFRVMVAQKAWCCMNEVRL